MSFYTFKLTNDNCSSNYTKTNIVNYTCYEKVQMDWCTVFVYFKYLQWIVLKYLAIVFIKPGTAFICDVCMHAHVCMSPPPRSFMSIDFVWQVKQIVIV